MTTLTFPYIYTVELRGWTGITFLYDGFFSQDIYIVNKKCMALKNTCHASDDVRFISAPNQYCVKQTLTMILKKAILFEIS